MIEYICGNVTSNIALNLSIISCLISTIRSQTDLWLGILSIPWDCWWTYWRRSWNSGSSTAEKGWSQAAIHLASSFSKCSWSQGSYQIYQCWYDTGSTFELALFLASCCSNICWTFFEMVSSSSKYFLATYHPSSSYQLQSQSLPL